MRSVVGTRFVYLAVVIASAHMACQQIVGIHDTSPSTVTGGHAGTAMSPGLGTGGLAIVATGGDLGTTGGTGSRQGGAAGTFSLPRGTGALVSPAPSV